MLELQKTFNQAPLHQQKKQVSWWQILSFAMTAVSGISLLFLVLNISWTEIWIFLGTGIAFFLPFIFLIINFKKKYPDGNLVVWIEKAFGKKVAGLASCFAWFSTIFFSGAIAFLMIDVFFFTFRIALNLPGLGIGKAWIWTKIMMAVWIVLLMLAINFFRFRYYQKILYLVIIIKLCLLALFSFIFFVLINNAQIKPLQKGAVFQLQESKLLFLIAFSTFLFSRFETNSYFYQHNNQNLKRMLVQFGIIFITIMLMYLFVLFPILFINQQSEVKKRGIDLLKAPIHNLLALVANNQRLRWLIVGLGVLLFFNLYFSCTNWLYSANKMLKMAAANQCLPRVLGMTNQQGLQTLSPLLSIVGSAFGLVTIGTVSFLLPSADQGLSSFLILFSIGLATLLISYCCLFCAAVKLRLVNALNFGPSWLFWNAIFFLFLYFALAMSGIFFEIRILGGFAWKLRNEMKMTFVIIGSIGLLGLLSFAIASRTRFEKEELKVENKL